MKTHRALATFFALAAAVLLLSDETPFSLGDWLGVLVTAVILAVAGLNLAVSFSPDRHVRKVLATFSALALVFPVAFVGVLGLTCHGFDCLGPLVYGLWVTVILVAASLAAGAVTVARDWRGRPRS